MSSSNMALIANLQGADPPIVVSGGWPSGMHVSARVSVYVHHGIASYESSSVSTCPGQ
jgi:hypothetical protein